MGGGGLLAAEAALELEDLALPALGEGGRGVGEGMVDLLADAAGRTIGPASADLGGGLQNFDLLDIEVSAVPLDG
jgi:hypothetical protein